MPTRNSSGIEDEAASSKTGRGQRASRAKHEQSTAENSPRGGGGGLERVTVNLIPRASRALEQAGSLTGDSKTDTINRALQVYAYLEEVWSKGGAVLVEIDGQRTELKFF